jgi:hypothetical protein
MTKLGPEKGDSIGRVTSEISPASSGMHFLFCWSLLITEEQHHSIELGKQKKAPFIT